MAGIGYGTSNDAGLPPVNLPSFDNGQPSGPLRITISKQPPQFDPSQPFTLEPAQGQAPSGNQPQFNPNQPFTVEGAVTPTGAGLEGLKSGLTAGFDDELAGASAAGRAGLPQDVNQALDQRLSPLGHLISAIGGGLRMAYDAATGDPQSEALQAYQSGRDKVRAAQSAAEQQQPGAYLAGNVGGALASIPLTPALDLVQGAGLGARTANAGLAGAGYGALYGAGSGQGATDTLTQAANGALVGGVGGGIAAPIMAGAGALASKVTTPIRAAYDPAKLAAQKVFHAIGLDRSGTTPEHVANSLQLAHDAGEPIVLADLGRSSKQGGRGAVHALARDAADSAIASKLPAAVSTRFENQGERFHNDIVSIVGGKPEATGIREELLEASRLANKPAYARAYAAGDKDIWSPELERLTGSPSILNAMRGAQSKWKDWQILDGFGAANPPVKIDSGGILKFLPGGLKTYPNIQYWDYTARVLSGLAEKARAAGNRQEAARFGGLEKKLKEELDKLVQAFKAARQGAAKFFGADNALEAGEEFVTSRVSNEEAKLSLAKMSGPERAAFAYGFASQLLKTIREIPLKDRSTIASKAFLNSPAAKERIQMALGPDGARKLEARVRIENMMEATRAAVKDGSHTSKLLKHSTQLGGSGLSTGLLYGFATGDWDTKDISIASALGALAKGGHSGISLRVAGKVSDLLATGDPDAIREAVKTVAKDPKLMDLFRRADSLVTRTLNTNSPNLIGQVAPQMAGHADQEKPDRK